jgi:predicted porin
MDGGRSMKTSAAAIALFAGFAMGGGAVQAADLGGNCCADLEERIAELEATTARKGNRKVSLEIYGQVNETLLFWDDGFESNAGVYTNDNSRTRIGFRGKAKINGDWEAGYRLEIGVRSANSKRFNQDDPSANTAGTGGISENGFDIRDSHWYLKSKSLGTASVGRQATAADGITEINQTQTADFSKYSDIEDVGGGLFLRRADGALSDLQWRRLIGEGGDQPGEGERRFDGVRYVSPEFAGFAVSAFWGADDFWDVALRYKGEFGGFSVAAGIGYGEITDGVQTQTTAGSRANIDAQQFGGSVSVLHKDTGLFVNFGAGEKEDDGLAPGLDNKDNFYSVQAGIEQKFFPLGKTTVFGEYYDYSGAALTRNLFGSQVIGSDVESYGFGVAQGVDAAALTLYLTYRHVTPEAQTVALPGGVALEEFDFVTAGGIIKF